MFNIHTTQLYLRINVFIPDTPRTQTPKHTQDKAFPPALLCPDYLR